MDRGRGDRGRSWDRDRSRSQGRDGDRDRFAGDAEFQRYRRPSRFTDGPPPTGNFRRSPGNFRTGFSPAGAGGHPPFDSPPRQPHGGGRGGFRPQGPGGGFRPVGGGGFDGNLPPPLSGQKRGFPFGRDGAAAEHPEGRSFVKLFVGSVPKTATEEDIHPLFEEHGRVVEVALIKDKRTGQQQGCCFVKYATSEEANKAIQFLHNQYTLPGGIGPIQVRYADGERERLGNGAVEFKLYVGSLNKQATEKEVEEIFAPYGRVDDVYLMRDEWKQSRGCGFVKFSQRESAMAAINALNGAFTMMGCEQPLIVRFADPKRPRAGESRGGPPSYGGPGVAPPTMSGVRPLQGPNFADTTGGHGPASGWHPMSPQKVGSSQNAGFNGMTGGSLGPQGAFPDGSAAGFAVPSSTMSPQLTQQIPSSYAQGQSTHPSGAPQAQLQFAHASGQIPYNHGRPSQEIPGYGGSLPSQRQGQQTASSPAPNQAPSHANLQPNSGSVAVANPQQLPTSMSQQSPVQSSSQLAQMLSQQRQSLQASLQSSQQVFSQLQQQVQMMQPSSQNQQSQQDFQTAKQQSQWGGVVPQAAGNASGVTPSNDALSTKSAAGSAPALPSTPVLKCNWTEHTSPDGFKYYYNNVTGESRWVKPEELAIYEQQQQQQKLTVQHPQSQPSMNAFPQQHASQLQQQQLQAQFRQQSSIPTPYQASGAVGNQNMNQNMQGLQAAQEWMWKNKSGGN